MSGWLLKVRDLAWTGAGICVAAFGFRCMVGAISIARAQSEPEATAHQSTKHAARPRKEPKSGAKQKPKPVPSLAESAEAVPSLRVMLTVAAGPERAEVYVNGRRLGLTPYLGDYTCKQGEELRFEIVPEKGPLITRRAACRGTVVSVR